MTSAPASVASGRGGLAGLVFLASLAIYASLVPWVVRAWPRTGDEPHYLLAAHSLAFDQDLDLTNNYARRDYLAFYGEAYLNPHTRPGPRGEAVLTHDLGLSLLVTPAYLVGGLAGVEYFMALVGALLAVNVFLLGYDLTGRWPAALMGCAAICFTPPVLWYVFLIYPETVAGLCVVLAVRVLIGESAAARQRASALLGRTSLPAPGPIRLSALILCSLALAALPWLSSRYLPVLAVLAGAALWRARAERRRAWVTVALAGLAGLGAYALFSLWLYGSAAPGTAYAGPTGLAFRESFAVERFARGIFGWLLDNQRGLLVTAPIYVAGLWGAALLIRRRPFPGLAVSLPLALTLAAVAVWGGFWVGWEYSARFLVIALPPLGAGVAFLWAFGRRLIVIPLTLLSLGLSLAVGRAVLARPIQGIVSSPVELLKPTVDIAAWLPAMARYVFIPAGAGASVGRAGGLGWQTTAGEGGIVLRQVDVPEFPFGWYTGRLTLQAFGDPAPDAPLATIKVFSPSGGSYLSQTVLASDVGPGPRTIEFDFMSPLYNGWGFPPTVLVSATGQADLTLGTLIIEPERFHSLVLPALWLLGLAAVGILATARTRDAVAAQADRGALSPLPASLLRPVTAVGLAAALGAVALSLPPRARTHAVVELRRTVGVVVADPAAYRGRALEALPDAGQEAGMLGITLPELYAPGPHRLIVSLRASEPAPAGSTVAAVRVLASEATALSERWEIPGHQLPADGAFHEFAFRFVNPRQQALTFLLDYPAVAGLRADVIRVEPLGP